MADIHLTRAEVDGDIPNACMCCGEPASACVERTFLVRDPAVRGPSVFWEVFAIQQLLALANTPRVRVRTTFCPRHRHYWTLRTVLLMGGMGGMFAVLLFGLVSVVLLITVAKIDAPWLSCCAIVPFLAYIVPWVIALQLVMRRTIRVRISNDDEFLLRNVALQYVAAMQEHRRKREDRT